LVVNVTGIALNTFGLEAKGFKNVLSLLTRGLVYQSWYNSQNEFISGTSWGSSEGSVSTSWSDSDATISTSWSSSEGSISTTWTDADHSLTTTWTDYDTN
jgi:hypothetical protein